MRTAIGLSIVLFGALTSLAGGPPASQPARDGDDLRRQLDRLSRQVLADPLDATAATRLGALREQQDQRRSEGLTGLADGLGGWLIGSRIGVAPALTRALASPDVTELADRILGPVALTLDQIVRQWAGFGETGVCPDCGQTHQADCTACDGAGFLLCRDCRGRGVRPKTGNRSREEACSTCRGTGAVRCGSCQGKGTVKCQTCAKETPAGGASSLPTDQRTAVERLAALARYLRDGGVDLYTPRALEKSPQMAE